jgi:hypothetical protein
MSKKEGVAMRFPSTFAAGAGLALFACPLAAQTTDDPMSRHSASGTSAALSTGIEYEEGDYGTGQRVSTTSIPASLRLSSGQFQFVATLPYVRVDAPGNVVGGGGLFGLPIIIDPGQPATRQKREGIGDLVLGAVYTLPSQDIGLSLSGQAKIPTASREKGLGTGKADYALGAELFKRIGRVTPFAGVGYSLPGDPDGYELRNSFSARVGAALDIGQAVRGQISYNYAQSASTLVPDEQQLSSSLHTSLSNRLSLGIYGSAGLSEGAPDVGAGVQIGVRLW